MRLLLRAAASEPHASLGDLLAKVDRGLRTGWIEGLSGAVAVGLVALADGAAEWVEAGTVTGVIARGGGHVEGLGAGAPALGDDAEHEYRSTPLALEPRDRIVALTGHHRNAAEVAQSVLVQGYVWNSRDALSKVLGGLDPVPVEGEDPSDISAAIITRTGPTP